MSTACLADKGKIVINLPNGTDMVHEIIDEHLESEGGYTTLQCQAGQYSIELNDQDSIYTRDIQALLVKYVDCPKFSILEVK